MPADNLVTLVMQQFGPSILDKLGSSLGINRDTAQTAVGSAVPALLAGLAGLASRPEGAAQLNAALHQPDSGLQDDLSSILGSHRQSAAVDQGQSLLGSLFGGSTMQGIAGALAKYTGLGQGTIMTLLGLLGPVVMGVLRRQQRSEGLNAGGLANLLKGQMGNIAGALPSGLPNMLRGTGILDSLGDRVGEGARAAGTAANSAAAAARSAAGEVHSMAGNIPGATARAAAGAGTATTAMARRGSAAAGGLPLWLLGIGALIVIGLIAYWLLGRSDMQTAVRQGVEQTKDAASSLVVGGVDLGKELTGATQSATSALQSVTDAASAKGALPKLQDATAQLDKLEGMKAQLPAAGKQMLADMIAKLQPTLQAAIDKVSTIPDAGDVLKPALDPLLAKLNALRAA
jgi:hypothetical protein